jgi:hypothetical protein
VSDLDPCKDTDPFLGASMLVYDHARLLAAESLLRKVALVNWRENHKKKLAEATKFVSGLSEAVAEELADLAELRRIAVEEGIAAKASETGIEAVVRLVRKVTSCDETVDLVREALAPWEEERQSG